MLGQNVFTTKDVSFIIKGIVHDLHFHGHKKLNGIRITAYKVETYVENTDGIRSVFPKFDTFGIPLKDTSSIIKNTRSDDGNYEIVFEAVPSGVYYIDAKDDIPSPKYNANGYLLSIVDGGTYEQDIFLADIAKKNKIDPIGTVGYISPTVEEIFMKD